MVSATPTYNLPTIIQFQPGTSLSPHMQRAMLVANRLIESLRKSRTLEHTPPTMEARAYDPQEVGHIFNLPPGFKPNREQFSHTDHAPKGFTSDGLIIGA
jgi:hypothetical protein